MGVKNYSYNLIKGTFSLKEPWGQLQIAYLYFVNNQLGWLPCID